MNSAIVQPSTVLAPVAEACRTLATFIVRLNNSVIDVDGTDALDLLNRLSTNDLTQLAQGAGALTVLVTDKARIIDVLTVLRSNHGIRLLGSHGTAASIVQWLRKYIVIDDARPRDRTAEYVSIDVEGPRSPDLLRELTGMDVSALAMAHGVEATINLVTVTVVRQPARCELRYRLLVAANDAEPLIQLLQSLGTVPELDPATDTYLRVMAGMGQIGHEWTDAYNPLEAGLLHMTSFTKGCYIGQEVIARLDSYNKVKQRVMGIVGGTELRQGDALYSNDAQVGVVTSISTGAQSNKHYGLAYVRREVALPDNVVECRNQHGTTSAVLRQLPMEEN